MTRNAKGHFAMDLITVFEKFGLPVAFLIIMIWLYTKAEDKFTKERSEHRSERKDWRESQQLLQSDTNSVLRDLTKVIGDSRKH